jgi:dihydrofolate reductase
MTKRPMRERFEQAFLSETEDADLARRMSRLAAKIHLRELKRIELEHRAQMQAEFDEEREIIQQIRDCTDRMSETSRKYQEKYPEFGLTHGLAIGTKPGIAGTEGTFILEKGEKVAIETETRPLKPTSFQDTASLFIDLAHIRSKEVQSTAPIVTMIAAVGRHNVIGMDQRIPWHIKGDFQHFKEVTMGKPMIMGRKTFDSIGKGLPGRLSIVVTRDKSERKNTKNVTFCHRTSEALEIAQEYLTEVGGNEIMIIGGEDMYRLFMPRADRLLITHVEDTTEGADTLEPGKVARFPIIHAGEWRSQGRDYPTAEQVNPGEPYWYVEEYRKRKPE